MKKKKSMRRWTRRPKINLNCNNNYKRRKRARTRHKTKRRSRASLFKIILIKNSSAQCVKELVMTLRPNLDSIINLIGIIST